MREVTCEDCLGYGSCQRYGGDCQTCNGTGIEYEFEYDYDDDDHLWFEEEDDD